MFCSSFKFCFFSKPSARRSLMGKTKTSRMAKVYRMKRIPCHKSPDKLLPEYTSEDENLNQHNSFDDHPMQSDASNDDDPVRTGRRQSDVDDDEDGDDDDDDNGDDDDDDNGDGIAVNGRRSDANDDIAENGRRSDANDGIAENRSRSDANDGIAVNRSRSDADDDACDFCADTTQNVQQQDHNMNGEDAAADLVHEGTCMNYKHFIVLPSSRVDTALSCPVCPMSTICLDPTKTSVFQRFKECQSSGKTFGKINKQLLFLS